MAGRMRKSSTHRFGIMKNWCAGAIAEFAMTACHPLVSQCEIVICGAGDACNSIISTFYFYSCPLEGIWGARRGVAASSFAELDNDAIEPRGGLMRKMIEWLNTQSNACELKFQDTHSIDSQVGTVRMWNAQRNTKNVRKLREIFSVFHK